MKGIYKKDEEVINTLTVEVKELFDPEKNTRNSDKFIEIMN